MNSKIFEKYKELQERFNLPQLNELKETFNFDIEQEENIFDQIRNEISDKLFTFTEKLIEPVIGGSDSFSCLFEQDMITEKDRNELFAIYKKIQVLKWENNMLTMKPDEKLTARWIQKAWDLWNSELEDNLAMLCKKLSTCWGNLKSENQKTYYHG
jgi:hypothetical protein